MFLHFCPPLTADPPISHIMTASQNQVQLAPVQYFPNEFGNYWFLDLLLWNAADGHVGTYGLINLFEMLLRKHPWFCVIFVYNVEQITTNASLRWSTILYVLPAQEPNSGHCGKLFWQVSSQQAEERFVHLYWWEEGVIPGDFFRPGMCQFLLPVLFSIVRSEKPCVWAFQWTFSCFSALSGIVFLFSHWCGVSRIVERFWSKKLHSLKLPLVIFC